MNQDVQNLKPEDIEEVRRILKSLQDTFTAKRSGGGLIPDEEIVQKALSHPERGDIAVTVLRDDRRGLQVFVSNRRDQDAPFAVMDGKRQRDFPERRALNRNFSRQLKDNETDLFLITQEDRDMLKHPATEKVRVFSADFGLNQQPTHAPPQADELRVKPLEQCNVAEKWQIYKKTFAGDARHEQVSHDLFGLALTFAKHKMPPRAEEILLSPEKYRERIAQLIRDIYPYGVRTSLRRDYPRDHAAKLEEVYEALRRISRAFQQRMTAGLPDALNRHYEEVAVFCQEVIDLDPELTRFT